MPPLQVATTTSSTMSTASSSNSSEPSDEPSDNSELEVTMPLEEPLKSTSSMHSAGSIRSSGHTKARRSSSMGFISRPFSKSQSKKLNNKSVRFADENDSATTAAASIVVIHPLPEGRLCDETRKLLWLTYQDKVTITDDVEEICYHLNCPDEIHPYVQHLDYVWDKCADKKGVLSEEECEKLVQGTHKGRGLEKKLAKGLKKNRDVVVKGVLDTQKTFRNLPVGSDQRAKLLKNKYKKLSYQSKVFAQALARGDQTLAMKYNPGPYKVVATSA